jgi:hypothetical protein
MLAYHGLEKNEDEDMENQADDNIEMENDGLPLPAATQVDLAMVAGGNEQADMEYFHFNDLVQPEVAHLQLGKVETFFFPVEEADREKFSPQGMEL